MDQPVKTQAEYTALLHTVLGARYGDAPRAFVHTYGCQGNVADGERIKGMLAEMGYLFTDTVESADLVLYNTCAVREHAEDRVFGNVGALKNRKAARPGMVVALCGCMMQQPRVAEKIRRSYPFVDLVFGTHVIHRLPELLYRTLCGRNRVFELPDEAGSITEGLPVVRDSSFKAFLPVMYGCNNFCSYCIVPYVRGRERSRMVEAVLEEARSLVEAGYRDITLLGQNVNSYGKDLETPVPFAQLLREINAIPGDFRIRFMTSHPNAAKDAERAIAGGTPQTLAQVSTPTFNSASASSWLWGVMITPDNDVVQTGIINWPSHLCSFTGNGYTSGVPDGYRKVNSALYDLIPETDIRKQWFLSPDNKSSLIDNEQIEGTSIVEYFGLTPYVNTKFGAYQSIFGNTTNASDWPLMRVEEMYLIKAEAEAMGGNLSGGKSTLENFVRTYRDPSFTSKANSAQDFQDEVWLQRRMELWGEGFSLFDILRLKKPVVRKNTNYDPSVQYNSAAEAQILIYRIPQCEMETNSGISDTDNNPAAPQPQL